MISLGLEPFRVAFSVICMSADLLVVADFLQDCTFLFAGFLTSRQFSGMHRAWRRGMRSGEGVHSKGSENLLLWGWRVGRTRGKDQVA